MKRSTSIALAATAVVAAALPYPAQAGCRGCAVGAGVIGGLAAGAIIGNAIANHPGYYTYDDYGEYAGPNCYWARKAWRDQDGNVHYSRPRKFCD